MLLECKFDLNMQNCQICYSENSEFLEVTAIYPFLSSHLPGGTHLPGPEPFCKASPTTFFLPLVLHQTSDGLVRQRSLEGQHGH